MPSKTRLFLYRHAHTVDEDEDPARPLTEKGKIQVRAVTEMLLRGPGVKVERVWHSPMLPARQTADIFCDALEITGTRREIDGLLPFDDVRGIARRLSGFGYPLLVVGHEPNLGRLISVLVCGAVDQEVVDLEKGGLVCLERESMKSRTILWRIRWYVTPSLMMDDGDEESPS